MVGKEEYKNRNKKLAQLVKENKFLIVSHRGQWGGNILENTINAVKVSYNSGSEIAEIDVCRSVDGKYFAFHTNNELRLLGDADLDLEKMTYAEIQEYDLQNSIGDKTEKGFELIEEILLNAPKEVIFQIDRSWAYWEDFLPFLDQFDEEIKQRIMIKSPYDLDAIEILAESKTGLMFLPFIAKREEFETLVSMNGINLIGIEVLADDNKDELYGKEFIALIHEEYNLIAQINAIRLNDKRKLYAGYDDDVSLLDHPDKGWGKLYEYGVDLIQTDWVAQLANYRNDLAK